MKRKNVLFFLLVILGISILPAFPQNFAGTVIDYVPAPGQHINIESIGTPLAAQKMVESTGTMVSLGSFGGYIILKFNQACVNHPENPYGIDFTVFGNAFSGSSEPGIVWVMQDSNRNGLPDDTWYEIAGSSHFFSETLKGYEVTYSRTSSRDVLWKDNLGEAGKISANEFNLQEYYPSPEYFPSYPGDSVTFTGTLLQSDLIPSGTGEIRLAGPAFGYADSHPRMQGVDVGLPDNPYTKTVEGAGGDPVDILWATDAWGNYVELDSIHFVKIVSASLYDAGWLGEISTDVAWVQAAEPQPGTSGKESLLVYSPHPAKIILGDSLRFEAYYFEQGRITDTQAVFHSSDEEVARIDASGLLTTQSSGEVQIRFTAGAETEYTSIKVAVPDSICITTDFSALYPGDTLILHAEIFDNYAEKISLTPRFSSSNPLVAKTITVEGQSFLVALQPGEFVLTASNSTFHLEEKITAKVHARNDKIKVLFTIKTAHENLLPLQPVEVGFADLNAFVENRQNDYSGLEKVTLYHALAQGLQKAGVPFRFRDDEASGEKLYLYMVENDGLFSYGWGGKISPVANARAWIARLNSNQYMNDFNSIPISDGDTIFLYHVPDILSSWNFTRLLSDRLVAEAGESIAILLEQTFCTYLNGEIKESGFSPVSDALINAGNAWYTNESGRAEVFPEGEFPLVISSGIDAIFVTRKVTVSADYITNFFTVYPNPVEDWLFISSGYKEVYGEGKFEIKLIGPAGRCVRKEKVSSLPFPLNLSAIAPGMYQLIISDDSRLEIYKIIKR